MITGRFPSTILFTDIVGSTERAADLGDHRWRELLERHHEHVRRQIRKCGGEEIATAGDGFLVLFDSPARALACADAIRRTVGELDLEIRCGVHFGQVERSVNDVGGIAVHTAARIAAMAGPGEVLASSTVRDAEAGSGFGFEDRGLHELRGVPGEWRIYALEEVPEGLEAGLKPAEPPPDLWTRVRESRFVRLILLYAAASWLVLQTTKLFIDSLGMPGWAMPAAAILLLIGLVVILATAWVQSHPLTPHREAAGEVPPARALDLGGIRDDIAQGRLPHLTWARALTGGVFAFALLFGIAGLYIVIQDRGQSFSPAEAVAESQAAPGIAVLPFSVRGQEMDVWREGLVDLLSTGLDGAAGLRAIDSRTVLARWGESVSDSANTDLATGLEVARRTGARYALVGSAVDTGADLRLVADVYRLEDGRSMGQARAEGSADSVLAIADRLAVEVLKVILQKETDLPRIDLARVTTASFPALKAYLEGEVLFRGGDFDAAIEAYERAVAADSTFALAYYRLGIAYGWDEALGSESSIQATDRAALLADRLPEREAVLVRALRAESQQQIDGIGPLRDAVQRFPDDAEAWYLLGDIYFHLGDQALVDVAESEPPLRRAVELQPRFAPYRIHLIDLAFTLHGDSAMAAREIAEYGRLAPGTLHDRAARAALSVAFGDGATRARGRAALDTLDLAVLRRSRNSLYHPRFSEEMDAISAAIIARSTNPGAQAGERIARARRAAFWKGRWRELIDVLDEIQPPGRACQLNELRSRGFPVDPATLDAALALGPADTTLAQGAFCKALYAAETGRWADHARVVGLVRREVENALARGDSLAASRERTGLQALDGVALWQRGEREEALPLLREVQTKVGGPVNPIVAELLLEMDRPDEAEPYLRAMGHDPLAHYQLAKIYEKRGDREAAAEAYEYFATHWRDADPEMQPLVADARQAAIRLQGLQRE